MDGKLKILKSDLMAVICPVIRNNTCSFHYCKNNQKLTTYPVQEQRVAQALVYYVVVYIMFFFLIFLCCYYVAS